MLVIRILLGCLVCLTMLCSVGYPNSSYLKAKTTETQVAANAKPLTKCPKRQEGTKTKNKTPACSPTQEAIVRKILASRGFKTARIIRGARTTAYAIGDGHTPGTRTKCGTRAGYGAVAVDPRVIRLRSKLYIPGYGFCQALDTGGKIKGKRVDLCFDSIKRAKQHGVKKKDIYVLTRAK